MTINNDNKNDNVYTAIMLQGGGALGAYEYRVLKALYDRRPGFTQGSPLSRSPVSRSARSPRPRSNRD